MKNESRLEAAPALRAGESTDAKRTEPSQATQSEQGSRIWRAMMLAPRLEVCEALLRGESVPVDSLDQQWAERFGIRPGADPPLLTDDELRRLARLPVAELLELVKVRTGEESA